MTAQQIHIEPFLPWVEGREDRLFRRMAIALVILFLILGLIMNSLTLPEIQKRKLADVSPRLAQLIQEKRKQPPPPPPKPKPEKKEVEKPKVEKKPPEKKQPEVKPKIDSRAAAKKQAEQSGLIAMRDELSDLRDSFDFSDISDLPQQKTGNQEETVVSTSNILSAKASQGSGGIASDSLNRQIRGSELAQRKTTQVESKISTQQQVATAVSPKSVSASRSQEEIERVFQKNKGAIFNIYNRELRKDPSLQGKVVFDLTISPEGNVTKCVIKSSELNNKKLEARLLAKIKQFKFANKKVPVITATYPIVFLPS